jgi:hypothetical protein
MIFRRGKNSGIKVRAGLGNLDSKISGFSA